MFVFSKQARKLRRTAVFLVGIDERFGVLMQPLFFGLPLL